jgi:hypothetical protein
LDPLMIMGLCGWALLSGLAGCKLAAAKSRCVWLWTSLGLLLNVPGVLVLALLPVRRAKAARSRALPDETRADGPSHRVAA